MKLILLTLFVLFANTSYAAYPINEDTEADIITISQSYAIAQVCEVTTKSLENAHQYLLEYIGQNIPAEYVRDITNLTTKFIIEYAEDYQGAITTDECNTFTEVWYQHF